MGLIKKEEETDTIAEALQTILILLLEIKEELKTLTSSKE